MVISPNFTYLFPYIPCSGVQQKLAILRYMLGFQVVAFPSIEQIIEGCDYRPKCVKTNMVKNMHFSRCHNMYQLIYA